MRIGTIFAILAVTVAISLLHGCDMVAGLFAPKPEIAYAPAGEGYAEKPDFAQVEYQLPIPYVFRGMAAVPVRIKK